MHLEEFLMKKVSIRVVEFYHIENFKIGVKTIIFLIRYVKIPLLELTVSRVPKYNLDKPYIV